MDTSFPPPLPAPASPAPRRGGGRWVLVLFLSLALAVSVLMNLGMGVSILARPAEKIRGLGHHHGGEDEFPRLTEKWSYGSGETKVARIALAGVISRAGEDSLFGSSEDLVTRVTKQIRQARNDEAIRAIILEVDSPGGGVTASDELWNELKAFKQSAEGRKVVVFMRDLCASGGYYVSAAGDWLISEPTTIVGSIGVIMSTLNMKGLSEKVGIKDVTIKSGANKDLLNPFNEVNPEQVALLQRMIDASYKRFFDIVRESRNFDEDKLHALADGRVVDAGEALQEGFVDQIGYWDDAVAKTAELLGKDSVKVVRYEGEPSLLQLLTSAKSPLRLPHAGGSRLQYLWTP